jgi:voltage-gated potassium channel
MERWVEPLMIALGLVWLALLVVDLARGLPQWAQTLSTAIWIVFIVEFLVRFLIAPKKLLYLRKNWLTLIALALPALRVLRIARALRLIRATRGLRLVRLLTSMSRGLKALGRAMQARGAGYVGAITVIVVFAGAAGMLAFESNAFSGYAEALWWTAMLITTVGSEYWPKSPEGRILALLISIYAVGVFGYLAATLASFLIGRGASADNNSNADIAALRSDIKALKEELANHRRERS